MTRKISLLLLAAFIGLPALVQAKFYGNAKYAGEYMNGQSNARLLALGGVGASIAEGPSAILGNPAGLFNSQPHALSLMHIDRFAGMVKVDHAAYIHHGNSEQVIGFGLLRQGVDDIAITELQNPSSPIGTDNRVRILDYGSASEYAFQVATARKRNFGTVGATAKLLYKKLYDHYGVGLGIDVGYQHRMGNLFLGGQVRNVVTSVIAWDTGSQEAILPNARFGVAYFLNSERLLATLLPIAEVEIRTESIDDEDAFALHFGLEHTIRDVVSARVGLDDGRLTYGAGFKVNLLDFDYAFVGHDDLGASHRISVAYRWGLSK
ncbi:hypothetical protein K8I28_12295 [bacterium]|nr:hypothetical protein [bacterium]